MIKESMLELYWSELPIGKENAWSYGMLSAVWHCNERTVREILHQLSRYDNGDDLILIRSSKGGGFYRTNNTEEIKAYRAECLNRGRNTLAPLKKIDRVLKPDDGQMRIDNNLKAVRVSLKLSATEVCAKMRRFDKSFDAPMLSKMESNGCLPTPWQLAHLAAIYGCTPNELVDVNLYRNAI